MNGIRGFINSALAESVRSTDTLTNVSYPSRSLANEPVEE